MKARVFSPSSSHRDGYRGMDTFPAQNQECLSCARPAPCTQPSLPCSTSMVSMSQGHWMREPRSEYAHMQSTCSRRGAHALSPRSLWCDINANAPLIHLKCRGNCFQYFNELVKDRNRRVHFTPPPPASPRLKQPSGEGFNTFPSSHFAWWCSDITLRWDLMFRFTNHVCSVLVTIWCGMNE